MIWDKFVSKKDELLKIKMELESSLQQINENLSCGQQLLHMGSWTYDLQKDEVYWTEGIFRILESSAQQLGDRRDNFYSFVHTDDREYVHNAVQGALEGKKYDIEFRVITSGGNEKYVQEKVMIILDNNNPIKIIGTLQDVTERKSAEKELRSLGDNLNLAQKVAGLGSWKYDALKNELFWSDEVYRIYNIDRNTFTKSLYNLLQLIHPDDQGMVEREVKKALTGKGYKIEYRIPQEDGSQKHVRSIGEPIFGEEQQVVGILGTLQDITEKKVLVEQLEASYRNLDQAQKLARLGSWEMDIALGKNHWSEETYNIYGISPEQYDGTYDGFLKFIHPDDIETIQNVLKDPPRKPFEMEFRIIRNDGSVRNVYQLVDITFDKDGTPTKIFGTIQDITERKELEERVDYMATHDDLTSLPNRSHFTNLLQSQCQFAVENQTKVALMMLDTDYYKYINDTLGYNLGDQLIIQIAQRLRSLLGEGRIISRYAGDQFAIIIRGFDNLQEYEKIAKGIIISFSEPFKIDIYELHIDINIGISLCPEDNTDSSNLIQYAKTALLRAKIEGKNRYQFYYTDKNIQYYKKFVLRNDLRKALEKKQFKVFYQPQVRLKTNEILGAEALLRWEHPDWGMVSPREFISLAEETGFIINLGNWVLREVCQNYKKWLDMELPAIKVSVNFSNIQFLEKNLVENIKNILDENGLDPSFLIMEITESALMVNYGKAIVNIRKLQNLGIEVALNDFGTGFSSLSYLKMFKADYLKIDRSFIKNIESDETNSIISRFLVNLGRELKIKLVAEGIETWEQLSYLKKLNCYAGQGYLYSKPVPLEHFEKILTRKICKPIKADDSKIKPHEERRKFFRIKFPQLLEADMTILEIMGKKTNVGSAKVLIKNMGPGGLCFVSNIRIPIERDIIIQFITQLLNEEIKLYGSPVWTQEINDNVFEYGIEFNSDENRRTEIIKILNHVQVKLRQSILFSEGRFFTGSIYRYFKIDQ